MMTKQEYLITQILHEPFEYRNYKKQELQYIARNSCHRIMPAAGLEQKPNVGNAHRKDISGVLTWGV